MVEELYTTAELTQKAKQLFKEERAIKRLDGWFLIQEIRSKQQSTSEMSPEILAAELLEKVVQTLPISLSPNAVFAGTQRDAFARSYALINPAFEVESFSGYCDPTAVFNDIEPNKEFPRARIDAVRSFVQNTPFSKQLTAVYKQAENYTSEVAYFVEQVTGHVIPDLRPLLAHGVEAAISQMTQRASATDDMDQKAVYNAMSRSLSAAVTLADRYANVALEQATSADPQRKRQLLYLSKVLRKVPAQGASDLYEAIQSFMILWQCMCLEQAPNPFAFSVGNADRIFEPYRQMAETDPVTATALLEHLLVFFNVGDRSWAISQNIIVGGRALNGEDLTNPTTYALLDAYFEMNMPQPILSVKLHKNTPDLLYGELGRFFFSPGMLTPSIFNDDALFDVLLQAGIAAEDLPDYSIAGCQEPLIMGKDNGNTTNSWLNLGKVLELTLHDGISTISGKAILEPTGQSAKERLSHLRDLFYARLKTTVKAMAESANGASEAVSLLPVPFLSAMMGGMESGIDMRDIHRQGTRYNGSGCLIHGISVVSDSFIAVDRLLDQRPQDAERLLEALRTNFEQDGEMREFLMSAPKYGNNQPEADCETAEIVERVADIVAAQRNYLNNPFRPDFSTPSTHLLYGYWVGATPDGRKAREMLGYGVDPLFGEASSGLGFRILSLLQLPFGKMNGGYGAHFGIDPKYFTQKTMAEKGLAFKERVINPLFFNQLAGSISPFYLYTNITTPDTLRKVLKYPAKYAPNGVYIMRIHGTFVNFLDLSPAIQNDIITRLDLESTSL